jgi:hypothetical protein
VLPIRKGGRIAHQVPARRSLQHATAAHRFSRQGSASAAARRLEASPGAPLDGSLAQQWLDQQQTRYETPEVGEKRDTCFTEAAQGLVGHQQVLDEEQ